MKIKYIKKSLAACAQMKYLYYIPQNNNITKTIILVHGISRNADEIMESFISHADKNNSLLIAPIFTKEYASDYQRLGRRGKGPRSDYLLRSVISEVYENIGMTFKPFYLFGFSAGAQFAHRYAFAHPTDVIKVALVAAGWYTLPIKRIDYPIGLKLGNQFNDIVFEPLRFLRTRFKVYIGENDLSRDKGFNKKKLIDELQGDTRVIRAENWVKLMNKQYKKHSIPNSVDLVVLNRVGHSFINSEKQAHLSNKVNNWFNQD